MPQVRIYEGLILLDQDLSTEQVATKVSQVEEYITSHDGEILRTESMGRRRLAYPVLKKRYGFYHVFYFKAFGAILEELKYKFRIDDDVLKHQFIVLEDKEFETIQPVTLEEEEKAHDEDTESTEETAAEGEAKPAEEKTEEAAEEKAEKPAEDAPDDSKKGDEDSEDSKTEE